MMNRCKFLNIALCICGISDTPCSSMPNPSSCPNYDESADRSYIDSYKGKKLTDVAKAETKRTNMEVESLNGFVDRIETELKSLGIKVDRAPKAEEEVPDWF